MCTRITGMSAVYKQIQISVGKTHNTARTSSFILETFSQTFVTYCHQKDDALFGTSFDPLFHFFTYIMHWSSERSMKHFFWHKSGIYWLLFFPFGQCFVCHCLMAVRIQTLIDMHFWQKSRSSYSKLCAICFTLWTHCLADRTLESTSNGNW